MAENWPVFNKFEFVHDNAWLKKSSGKNQNKCGLSIETKNQFDSPSANAHYFKKSTSKRAKKL